jgi:hypothetical protein
LRADGHDLTDNFMPWNPWQHRLRELTVEQVQISAADTAGQHLDQQLMGVRCRDWTLFQLQRLAWGMQNHGAHDHSPE